MRVLFALTAFGAAFAVIPVTAQEMAATSPANLLTENPSEETRPPAKLSPLAADSPWRARFEAVADALLPALQSRDASRWQPMLGGQWQSDTDQQAVAAFLADENGAFAPLVAASSAVNRRILGWSVPSGYTAADRAEIQARPEAEALLCWSAQTLDDAQWPQTADDADNAAARPYACARVTYSLRDGASVWRGFIETPAPPSAH